MSETILGTTPDDESGRDAIHIAVFPAVAGQAMRPGARVGLSGDSQETVVLMDDGIGIVDPFLRKKLNRGDRCFVLLYPNTISGLRHVWSHPMFVDLAAKSAQTPNDQLEAERAAAKEWLTDYAIDNNPYESNHDGTSYGRNLNREQHYERFMEQLRSRAIYFYGSDLHGLYELPEPEELRRNAELVLGYTINWDDFRFSCSC